MVYSLQLLRTHLLNAHAVKKHYVTCKTNETECDTVVEKRNYLEKVHNELKMLIFKILLIPSAAIGGWRPPHEARLSGNTYIYIYVPLMGILLDKVNSIIKWEMLNFYVYCPLKGLKHDLSLNLLKFFLV